MRVSALLVVLVALVSGPRTVSAQGPEARGSDRLRVFLDCQTVCDQTFIRTEITWVDWVRDREDAAVHVLVTGEGTGGGGRRYSLDFIGRGPFQGDDHTMTYTSSGDATSDEARTGFTRVLGLGLTSYARGSAPFDRLSVQYRPPRSAPGTAGPPQNDPWDFWVFRLGLNAYLNGESLQSSSQASGSLNASRTTDDWKLSFSGSYSKRSSTYELSDRSVTTRVEDWSSSGLAVKSLGDHWSLGARASAGSSTFYNQDFRWSLQPGVEFNFFPYGETARRELTLQYLVGINHWDYTEETLFGEISETRPSHSVVLGLDLTQPWGRTSISISGSQYLHDASRYSAGISGYAQVRLFKGFSFNVNGSYSRVHDQLYLPKGDATDDEILTRQRQLETSYFYYTSFGISYRFGSIFNNVVNPRFGSSPGGTVIYF